MAIGQVMMLITISSLSRNMFAVATLKRWRQCSKVLIVSNELSAATLIASEVRAAIETYATYNHPTWQNICFETNGFSVMLTQIGKLLMDAANIPSLLSIPWLGYAAKDDATYLNTRALS